ncbi:MAG: prephenate dehydrogenase/arogenate dehydrogenase family protein [Bacillota bacterium]
MALGKHNVVEERWGYDVNAWALQEARARGAVDKIAKLPLALQDAELVILSMPVKQILKLLKEISPFLQKGILVTDVGSTKKMIVEAMENVLPPGVTGIGGHPMAGSEKAGITAADPLLLQGAAYLLTPTKKTPRAALQKIEKTILAIGAHPLILSPEEHDRLTALISHLPQFVSAALVNTLRNYANDHKLLQTIAGRGFKDTTRIAMGNAEMWYDIFTTNKVYLMDSLKNFLEELHALVDCLEKGKGEETVELLKTAGLLRSSFCKEQIR